MGACGLVNRVVNSRSTSLGSIPTAGHVYKCQANFSFYTASAAQK